MSLFRRKKNRLPQTGESIAFQARPDAPPAFIANPADDFDDAETAILSGVQDAEAASKPQRSSEHLAKLANTANIGDNDSNPIHSGLDSGEDPTIVRKAPSIKTNLTAPPPPKHSANKAQRPISATQNDDPDEEKTVVLPKRQNRRLGHDLGHLIVREGRMSGKIYTFSSETAATLGKRNDCEVDLSWDQGVSRYHAKIRMEEGQFYLYDLASTNGTLLNGSEVTKSQLKDGDEICLGATPLLFKWTQLK